MREVSAEEQRLARIIREACIQAAREGYEQAAMSGLCHEGAWEAAIGAIQRLDLEALLKEQVIE
ncbi:MAG: acetyltransferase [Candidatus Binatia bacterium]